MRSTRQGRIVAALLVLLFLIAALPASAASQPPTVAPLVRVSGPSPLANCPQTPPAAGVNYPNAEVEPAVAANPATVGTAHVNLVGVWQQDRWSDGGARGIATAASFDGGHTWQESLLPFGTCVAGSLSVVRISDPSVSIGGDGTVYASGVAVSVDPRGGGSAAGVLVAASHDGGRSWTDVQRIHGATGGDGAHVVADPSRPGVAYLTWPEQVVHPASVTEVTKLSRTTDGGRTWSGPRSIVPKLLRGQAGSVEALLDLFVDGRTHRLYSVVILARTPPPRRICKLVKGKRRCRTQTRPLNGTQEFIESMASRDGGVRWSKPTLITQVHFWKMPVPPLRASLPLSAAIDPTSGSLYIAWEDGRFTHGKAEGVAVVGSTDGGKHWSSPHRADTPSGRVPRSPTIAVNTNGTVGVMYYTVPATTSTAQALPTRYWFVTSHDHGRSFSRAVPLGGSFDLRTAPTLGLNLPKDGSYFLGDYQGLAAGTDFYPFFVMANSGDMANRTDVFSTVAAP